MFDTNYQKTDKLFIHDRFMNKIILWMVPKWLKPNHFTVFRFVATPFVALLMIEKNYIIGLLAFLLVAFTDAIDGSLARTRNQITEWGKLYDPLADKLLIAAMVYVIVYRYIDVLTATLIVALEAIIIVVAWFRKAKGAHIQANIWGKIKMILQVTGVVILLLAVSFDWASLLPFASGVLYLAIAFAVVSLLTYGI